jgi:hypothetical protein
MNVKLHLKFLHTLYVHIHALIAHICMHESLQISLLKTNVTGLYVVRSSRKFNTILIK